MKSDKVYIKKSNIHGMGVFADRDFKKGEVILHWDTTNFVSDDEYNKASYEEKRYITFLDNKHIRMQEPEKFVNHSCSSNTAAKNYCDVALRDIKKDEEITANYTETSTDDEQIVCNCGSDKCKKIVIS